MPACRDWHSKLLSRLPAPVRDFLGSPAVLTNCLVALNMAAFAAQMLTEGRVTAWGAKVCLHSPACAAVSSQLHLSQAGRCDSSEREDYTDCGAWRIRQGGRLCACCCPAD